MSDDKIKKIAEITGLAPELIQALGAENLTEEKLAVLKSVSDLYASDQESFAKFITESGLGDLAGDLAQSDDLNNPEQIDELKNSLEDLLKDQDFDLDL